MSLENEPAVSQVQKRRPKRPSVQAMIKAATKAGLVISAIECDENGVRLQCGSAPNVYNEDNELDQRMTEQMGVARVGGRKRR